MNAIKTILILLVAGLTCVSCTKESKEVAAPDTPEAFVEKYKVALEVGGDEVMKLIYKSDQMPEEMKPMFMKSTGGEGSMKLVSVDVEAYDEPNYDEQIDALKEMGMTMPVKPSHTLKVAFESEDGNAEANTSMTMGKIDGTFYLIVPVKAK